MTHTKTLAMAIAVAISVAACNTTGTTNTAASVGADPLRNISFEGTPNDADVGRVNPQTERITVAPGGSVRLGGFRHPECGKVLDFRYFVEFQTRERELVVPDGFTLKDGGVGWFNSRSCGGRVNARSLVVDVAPDVQVGTVVEFRFSDSGVTKTVAVEEPVGLRAKMAN